MCTNTVHTIYQYRSVFIFRSITSHKHHHQQQQQPQRHLAACLWINNVVNPLSITWQEASRVDVFRFVIDYHRHRLKVKTSPTILLAGTPHTLTGSESQTVSHADRTAATMPATINYHWGSITGHHRCRKVTRISAVLQSVVEVNGVYIVATKVKRSTTVLLF